MRLNYNNFGPGNLGATYNGYGSQGFTPGFSSYGGYGGMPYNGFGSSAFGVGSSLGGALGSALGGIFGSQDQTNPMQAAFPYTSQIPGILQNTFNPYIQQGQSINLNPYIQAGQNVNLNPYMNLGITGMQLQGGLQNQLQNMVNNPAAMMNKIGQSYHSSPGFQFELQQGTNNAINAANRAAAAGGMVGSPSEQSQLARNVGQFTTGLANQDYNQYMQNALGQYGTGLQGLMGLQGQDIGTGLGVASGLEQQGLGVAQGLEQQGFGAAGMLGSGLSSYMQAMAQMAAAQQAAQNQQQQQQSSGLGGIFGSILGGAASFIPGVGPILSKII